MILLHPVLQQSHFIVLKIHYRIVLATSSHPPRLALQLISRLAVTRTPAILSKNDINILLLIIRIEMFITRL